MVTIKTTRQIINKTPRYNLNKTKEKLNYNYNTKWALVEEQKKEYDKFVNLFINKFHIGIKQDIEKDMIKLRNVLFGE